MKDDSLFAYHEFVILNIDEKKYPITANEASNNEHDEYNNHNNSNALVAQNTDKYCIPKSALLEQLEKFNFILFKIIKKTEYCG